MFQLESFSLTDEILKKAIEEDKNLLLNNFKFSLIGQMIFIGLIFLTARFHKIVSPPRRGVIFVLSANLTGYRYLPIMALNLNLVHHEKICSFTSKTQCRNILLANTWNFIIATYFYSNEFPAFCLS
jgi:hypothetical protein